MLIQHTSGFSKHSGTNLASCVQVWSVFTLPHLQNNRLVLDYTSADTLVHTQTHNTQIL